MPKNVFISWSGQTSYKVAQVLYDWLPNIIQSIDPFLSSEDVEKGVRWFNEISDQLEQISFGIVCLTQDNMNAPWILFEAGALSRRLGQSCVTPLLIHLSNSDLQGPLAQFNTTSLTEADMKRLMKGINLHLRDKGIPERLLDRTFEISWPLLKKQLDDVLAQSTETTTKPSNRPQPEILEEILKLTRSIAQVISTERTEGADARDTSHENIAKISDQLLKLRDETRDLSLLDTISHELLSPIVGIRSHASFLQRRFPDLPAELVETKLSDIITDCEILFQQVKQLEYVLGRKAPSPTFEKTNVFRDIVIKTIHQLKPLMFERGFNTSQVDYQVGDASRIIVFADKAKLQQVVYNILINAIKYAEEQPDAFRLTVTTEETKDNYIIRFQDWGIGLPEGSEEKIFDVGFRAPNAIQRNVTGSGLGLSIAKGLMKEMGGDIVIGNSYKPTEFKVIIPKSLKEAPNDLNY